MMTDASYAALNDLRNEYRRKMNTAADNAQDAAGRGEMDEVFLFSTESERYRGAFGALNHALYIVEQDATAASRDPMTWTLLPESSQSGIAPWDGRLVDLWIVGSDNTVDFYGPTAVKSPGKPLRAGRACNFYWAHNLPDRPNWYPYQPGLPARFPLSPDVQATHWMPVPDGPKP